MPGRDPGRSARGERAEHFNGRAAGPELASPTQSLRADPQPAPPDPVPVDCVPCAEFWQVHGVGSCVLRGYGAESLLR